MLLSDDDTCPAVYVWLDAVLDVAKLFIELAADGTRLSVLGNDEALLGVEVVDSLDGTDDGCCATCACLFEGGKFFLWNLPAFYFQTEILSKLHQALVGDAGQDAGALRGDISVVLDAEEVGGAALVHVLLFLCVEIELAAVAKVVGHLIGTEAGCIVAADFVDACSERSRTVVLTDDDVGVCGKSAFEVWSDGCDEDEEKVFAGGMHTYLSARADEQGTDVECGSALVWRDEALVEAHHFSAPLYQPSR